MISAAQLMPTTQMIQDAAPPEIAEHADQVVAAMTPMGRMGTSEEIAYGALYLASD